MPPAFPSYILQGGRRGCRKRIDISCWQVNYSNSWLQGAPTVMNPSRLCGCQGKGSLQLSVGEERSWHCVSSGCRRPALCLTAPGPPGLPATPAGGSSGSLRPRAGCAAAGGWTIPTYGGCTPSSADVQVVFWVVTDAVLLSVGSALVNAFCICNGD